MLVSVTWSQLKPKKLFLFTSKTDEEDCNHKNIQISLNQKHRNRYCKQLRKTTYKTHMVFLHLIYTVTQRNTNFMSHNAGKLNDLYALTALLENNCENTLLRKEVICCATSRFNKLDGLLIPHSIWHAGLMPNEP